MSTEAGHLREERAIKRERSGLGGGGKDERQNQG